MTRPTPEGRAGRLPRRAAVAVLMAWAATVAPRGVLAADTGAEAFVDSIGSETLAILRDPGLDQASRVAALRVVLDRSFDLPFITRAIAGRHWRAMSPAQRTSYATLFDRLLSKTMGERIGGYGGETFVRTRTTPIDERDTMVGTAIRRPGGPAWAIDWRARKLAQGYRLVDVAVEGISMVMTQRAEVDGLVRQSGLDGLIAEMRRRSQSPDAAVTARALPRRPAMAK